MERMVDRIAKKKREEKKKKKKGWDFEDLQIERPTRQRGRSLNDEGTTFSSVMQKGINTEQSLFDREAVFRVTKNQ